MAALAFSAIPRANAEVSVDFFYNNLDGGSWYETADYGYVWQPSSASSSSWRPYSDGYWSYTDQGWVWVSYEDFGWATYHYGRWAHLNDRGWCWVPGTDWGGAWVSWRTGGDYVGWAPLPPVRGEMVYGGEPITGYVDVQFDIGPSYYNFIDVRYIGEPVLRSHIYDYNQNITYINNTVNVTNITYNDNRVYNYGPDYALMSKYSVKPIQKLQIQQQASSDPAAFKGGLNKVQGNQLIVASPMKLQKLSSGAAPKSVKGKLDGAKFDTGWNGVSDPTVKQKLVQKFKSENPKNIPAPDIQPKGGAAATTSAAITAPSAAAAANATTDVKSGGSEQGKGKRGGKRFDETNGAAMPSPAASTAIDAGAGANAATDGRSGGKGKRNRLNDAPRAATPAGLESAPGQTGAAPVAPQAVEPERKHKGERMRENAPVASTPGDATSNGDQGGGRRKGRRFEEQGAANVPPPGGGNDVPQGGGRRRDMRNGPPAGSQSAAPQGAGNAAPQEQGPREGGKHRKDKGEPVVSPTP